MLGVGKNTVEIIIAAKDRTSAAFAKVNTQMKTMGGGAGRLGGAMNGLKGGLSHVSSSLGSFGAALGPVGIAVAGLAVVTATLGGAAIKTSLEFEKAVATIRVGTGATGDALAGLEGSFKTVFTAVPTSTANAATAIADLNTRLGLTGEPLEALATQFLNLSRITGTDVAASISSATRVMHDFAVSTEEQGTTLDYLFKVSQSTGLGMTQLGNSMTQYGSVMRQMGFDINESAALLGKFEKEGVNLELVLGSLRQGLAKFSKAGEEPVEALARVSAEIQSMSSVADANALAIETFGARAGPDMAAAIREGRFSIEELMASLDASSETINKAAADTLTFGDKWTLLKNNIMTAIAPIGDVILNVLGGAMDGAMAAFALARENIDKFKSAIAPLTSLIGDLFNKLSGGRSIIQNLKDVVTVLWVGLKLLGDAIIWLIGNAISVLVDRIREGIAVLTNFYDKLGPLKTLIEGVKGAVDKGVNGFHNFAESLRDVEAPIKEVEEALEELAEEGPKAPVAIADAWAIAVKAFQDGAGTYKDAVTEINKEVGALKEEWKTATDERKAQIDKAIILIHKQTKAVEAQNKVYNDHFVSLINDTEEATEKTKEFTVTIGNTTIEFKGAAAEVVKNADAYEKLQKSAQTLIDLDWSVFTEFEASLPRIDAGLGDMASSLVGLKDVLEDNIEELENIQDAIRDINEIGAPFIEKGFLKGIEAIGKFAGALKTAGGAINNFSSLQDISIDGCVSFSLHVHDMVSALEILENQMEDLVPAFADMDSLITNFADAFVYGAGKGEKYQNVISTAANRAITDLELQGVSMEELVLKYKEYMEAGVSSSTALSRSLADLGVESRESLHAFFDILEETGGRTETFGWGYAYAFIAALEAGENLDDWSNEFLHTSSTLTHQMDTQTNALKAQTSQLAKITDALQPYLEFMRTLNELAALSTVSTTDLNNGLNSIKDTLNNLGTALSTFDLRPVMESLFGTKIPGKAGKFTGGIATGFTDVMAEYQSEFSMLIEYVSRLSFAISSLVNSFEALTNISKSVLIDQVKLKKVFEDVEIGMSNFSSEMGGTEGFAAKFAEGMEAMLTSAGPLIDYFNKDNAAVVEFNNSLGIFRKTISNVTDTMDLLKNMAEMTLPTVGELEAGFDKAAEGARRFTKALQAHMGLTPEPGFYGIGQEKMDKMVFTAIPEFAKVWEDAEALMGDTFETFKRGVTTITELASGVMSLVSAFKSLAEMQIVTKKAFSDGMKDMAANITNFGSALKDNIGSIEKSLETVDEAWSDHAETMNALVSTFDDATGAINKLAGGILSVVRSFESLKEIDFEKEFNVGFRNLTKATNAFGDALAKNIGGLLTSMDALVSTWKENEKETVYLMRAFITISQNFMLVIGYANALQEAFDSMDTKSHTLSGGFEELTDFMNGVIKGVQELYTTEAASDLAQFVTDVGEVVGALSTLEETINTAMATVHKKIETVVNAAKNKVKELSALPLAAFWWGRYIVGALIIGMQSKHSALRAEMIALTDIVAEYIQVGSDTKRGALSHLTDWPKNLISTFAEGIRNGIPDVSKALSGLASPIDNMHLSGGYAGMLGGGSNTVTMYNTWNVGNQKDADYAISEIERMLTKKAVL